MDFHKVIIIFLIKKSYHSKTMKKKIINANIKIYNLNIFLIKSEQDIK